MVTGGGGATTGRTARGGRDSLPYGRAPAGSTLGDMFVRYFLELPLPAGRVEQALLDSPAEWLSAVAGTAQRRGDELLAQVGVGPLVQRLAHRVTITIGSPVRFPSMTSLPLTWEPTGHQGLLPRLEADLEVGPLGADRTQLAISARYRPPLGVVGQAIDRVLLHRVAEATVKDFLDRLSATITGRLTRSLDDTTMRS
jgi:hypothetical protein